MDNGTLLALAALPLALLLAFAVIGPSWSRWLCGLGAVALVAYAFLYCFEVVPRLPNSTSKTSTQQSAASLPPNTPPRPAQSSAASPSPVDHEQTTGKAAPSCYHVQVINRTAVAVRFETASDGVVWTRGNLPPEIIVPTLFWIMPDKAIIRYVQYPGGLKAARAEWRVQPRLFAHQGNDHDAYADTSPLYEFIKNEEGLIDLRPATKPLRGFKQEIFGAGFENTTEFAFQIEFLHDHGFHAYPIGAQGAIDSQWFEPREEADREILVRLKSGQRGIDPAANHWKVTAASKSLAPKFQFYLTDKGKIDLRGPNVISERRDYRP